MRPELVPEKGTVPQPVIQRGLGALNEEISQLDEIVDKLRIRLDPVVRPADDGGSKHCGDDAQIQEQTISLLAYDIMMCADRVDNIGNSLEALLNNLDI